MGTSRIEDHNHRIFRSISKRAFTEVGTTWRERPALDRLTREADLALKHPSKPRLPHCQLPVDIVGRTAMHISTDILWDVIVAGGAHRLELEDRAVTNCVYMATIRQYKSRS